MKRASETNSRPRENRTVRSDYINLHAGSCELWEILQESNWEGWTKIRDAWLSARGGREADLRYNAPAHHIFHCGNRPDVTSNLIIAGLPAHAFVHAHPVEGTIACLYIKVAKGDLDAQEMFEVSGRNVIGWLEMDAHKSPVPFFDSLRQRTLELLVDPGNMEGDQAEVDPGWQDAFEQLEERL